MKNANALILVSPIEKDLVPAVDNALRQITHQIVGLKNQENKRKIEEVLAKRSVLQALVFALDSGFCARLSLAAPLKDPARIPRRFLPFVAEIAAGWVQLLPGETRLLYPKDPVSSQVVMDDMLGILSESNVRETFKEGMSIIHNEETWEKLMVLAEGTCESMPRQQLSLDAIWDRVRSGRLRTIHAVELALHFRRSKDDWVYRDREIYGLVKKCLSKAVGTAETAYLEFIAGLCAYHQDQLHDASVHMSEAYKSGCACSWMNEALARIVFVGEDQRDFRGKDESVYHLYKRILRAARSDKPVLIVGERGTGKELVAREIHNYSRPGHSLITINIGVLGSGMVHSELFGHEKGAFAGADRRNIGAFGRAGGGTLFIDEISSADFTVQKKLLRAIEYGKYYRVGGEKEVESKTRIVCATNKELSWLVRQNAFMEDLLNRISVFQIRLKPLHEMGADAIRILESELPDVIFGEDAREFLRAYNWPGNFRELKAVAERIRASQKKYVFQEDLTGFVMAPLPAVPSVAPQIDYDVPTIQEFRKILKGIYELEIKKYVCNQYVKQQRDWKKMLEVISARREHRHNTKECLKRCGLTERSVERSCSSFRES